MKINFHSRAMDLLLKPKETWEEIKSASESYVQTSLYPAFIAIIPAVAVLLGYWLVGFPGQTVKISFLSAFFVALVFYLLALMAVFLTAAMISVFCNYFNIEGDWSVYLKLAAYSSTAPILANVFYILPIIRYLKIAGFYGCVTLFVGLPIMLRIPKEKEMQFTMTIVICAIIIAIVFSGLIDQFIGPLYLDVI